ncbi:hypothetical protein [Caulobacter sp. 1776]|uniref:hypothetical protein n=1 Tax=Caulobacter sp. 1776 TaxID=3156420 RepID=UPI00339816B6
MALVSPAEYAAQHGVSKQAVAKWKAKGYLALREDKVDVERSDRVLEHAGLGRFKTGAGVVDRQPPPVVEVDGDDNQVVAPLAAITVDDEAAIVDFIGNLLRGKFASIAVAATVKENALAATRLLELQRKSEQLVELEVAQKVYFELARIARDAWLAFPTRIGPLLAADLGIEPDLLVEALTAHVHQQIASLGEPEPDFTKREE